GQLSVLPTLSSTSAIPVSVTASAFVTTYEYVTVCGADRLVVADDFTSDSSGAAVEPTVTASVGAGTAPFVAEPAVVIEPASRSACVTACEAVQVNESPGASGVVGGQTTGSLSSLTVNGPGSVTLPVFVTVYVYVIGWPRWSYDIGEADLSS